MASYRKKAKRGKKNRSDISTFSTHRGACFWQDEHGSRRCHLKIPQSCSRFFKVKLSSREGGGEGEGGEAWLDRRDKGVKLRERSLCRELLGLIAPIRQPDNWITKPKLNL